MDILDLLARELGPPPGRGASVNFWRCPFHNDSQPSLTGTPDGQHWKCFGCGKSGDAIALVRGLKPGIPFSQAVSLAGEADRFELGPNGESKRKPLKTPPRPLPKAEPKWSELVEPYVRDASVLLLSDEGSKARAYLNARGIPDEVIKSAGLGGCAASVKVSHLGDDVNLHVGIWIPWRDDAGRVIAIMVRRPKGCDPKYLSVKGSTRRGCYPRPPSGDLPIIVVEGELDALTLGSALAGAADVVTLGSASSDPERLDEADIARIISAPAIYAAHDNDPPKEGKEPPGEIAAKRLIRAIPGCVRVIPPRKDWTDTMILDGVNLRDWWAPRLGLRIIPALHLEPAPASPVELLTKPATEPARLLADGSWSDGWSILNHIDPEFRVGRFDWPGSSLRPQGEDA